MKNCRRKKILIYSVLDYLQFIYLLTVNLIATWATDCGSWWINPSDEVDFLTNNFILFINCKFFLVLGAKESVGFLGWKKKEDKNNGIWITFHQNFLNLKVDPFYRESFCRGQLNQQVEVLQFNSQNSDKEDIGFR